VSPCAVKGVQGILIDLDGTILDTVGPGNMASSWRAAAEAHAADLRTAGVAPDALLSALSREARWFWSDPGRHRWARLHPARQRERTAAAALRALGVEAPRIAASLAERYWAEQQQRFALFPGAIAALGALRRRFDRLVLVTNGDSEGQRAKIARFDLARWFDAIQIEEEQGVGKPEADAYRRALAAGGFGGAEAVMVGDHFEWEVAAPLRLGVRAIWVNTRGLPRPHAPATGWEMVHNFAQVPACLQDGRAPSPEAPARKAAGPP
jgi:putative hydrolase of the HAD superfamily